MRSNTAGRRLSRDRHVVIEAIEGRTLLAADPVTSGMINALPNQPPRVQSVIDNPDPALVGTPIVLTAVGVSDPNGNIARVTFYRETNGIGGLQPNGDLVVAIDTSASGGYSVAISTAALGAGTYRYYAVATDTLGATSFLNGTVATTTHTLERPASIAGTIYRDSDGDGFRDPAEPGIGGVREYIDKNGNSKYDTGEPTVSSDSAGRYAFTGLVSGTYVIRSVIPSGHMRTAPMSDRHVVSLAPAKQVTGVNFGSMPEPKITGGVFDDRDRDGVWDTGETGISGFRVYIDANRNGAFDSGEMSVLTGSTGAYSFNRLRAGTYVIRFVPQTTWRHTRSTVYTVNLLAGQVKTRFDFGMARR